jgi:hypothetical protein
MAKARKAAPQPKRNLPATLVLYFNCGLACDQRTTTMPHLITRNFWARSNNAVAQALIVLGFGACVIAALFFDVRQWLM